MRISQNYSFMLSMGLINTLLNILWKTGVASLLWGEQENVRLWGPTSMAVFLIACGGITGFGLGLTVTKITRQGLRKQKVLPLHWHLKSQTLVDRLPASMLSRAFMLALCGVLFNYIILVLLEVKGKSCLQITELYLLLTVLAACEAISLTVMAFYRTLGDTIQLKSKQA
ncbi:hypothetical protein [Pontibacter chitinilyticus]|uniref:hypothetical protein n=1 Tax=Pontibacter chitinilyticus TaxID=2674989 RepID=UPI003219CFFA